MTQQQAQAATGDAPDSRKRSYLTSPLQSHPTRGVRHHHAHHQLPGWQQQQVLRPCHATSSHGCNAVANNVDDVGCVSSQVHVYCSTPLPKARLLAAAKGFGLLVSFSEATKVDFQQCCISTAQLSVLGRGRCHRDARDDLIPLQQLHPYLSNTTPSQALTSHSAQMAHQSRTL